MFFHNTFGIHLQLWVLEGLSIRWNDLHTKKNLVPQVPMNEKKELAHWTHARNPPSGADRASNSSVTIVPCSTSSGKTSLGSFSTIFIQPRYQSRQAQEGWRVVIWFRNRFVVVYISVILERIPGASLSKLQGHGLYFFPLSINFKWWVRHSKQVELFPAVAWGVALVNNTWHSKQVKVFYVFCRYHLGGDYNVFIMSMS